MSEAAPRPARRGLFFRIVVSFVGAVLLFVAASVLLTLLWTRGDGTAWVSRVVESVDAHNDEIVEGLRELVGGEEGKPPPPDAVHALVQPLADELGASVDLVPVGPAKHARRRGHRPPGGLHLDSRERRQVRRGAPVVSHPRRFGPPRVVWRIFDAQEARMVAFVIVQKPGNPPLAIAAGMTLLLGSLFAVAWPLARSLTGRLRALEQKTQSFAAGELETRADIPKRGDEVDLLASAFNDMAARIQQLILGQRTLLTNVSHELRTPLARMRVLLEILEERAAKSPYGEDPGTARVRQGLEELHEDVDEMNRLVEDLLTSGRLELGRAIEHRPFDIDELGTRVAAKVDASYTRKADDSLEIEGDPLLLERLLSNLLANARRAGPKATIEVLLELEDENWLVVVQDEGPGVPPERREEIFEPFTRLDSARSRDAGGVGLGLHLSRQIARAHGGTLRCLDRPDGKQGARFELRIPRERSPSASAKAPATT